MELAQPADGSPSTLTRAERPGWSRGWGAASVASDARRDERLEVALDVVKVDGTLRGPPLLGEGVAVRDSAQPQRLVGFVAVAPEAAAHLEHPDALVLAREVGPEHIEEAAGQRRAHHVEVARDRIQHGDRRVGGRRARGTARPRAPSSRS